MKNRGQKYIDEKVWEYGKTYRFCQTRLMILSLEFMTKNEWDNNYQTSPTFETERCRLNRAAFRIRESARSGACKQLSPDLFFFGRWFQSCYFSADFKPNREPRVEKDHLQRSLLADRPMSETHLARSRTLQDSFRKRSHTVASGWFEGTRQESLHLRNLWELCGTGLWNSVDSKASIHGSRKWLRTQTKVEVNRTHAFERIRLHWANAAPSWNKGVHSNESCSRSALLHYWEVSSAEKIR